MGALVVDRGARTITGLAVPYGRQARVSGRRYRFQPGWARHGRVRLLYDHLHSQRLGHALALADIPAGLLVVLRVDGGRRGDRVLEQTDAGELGLSVGPEYLADGLQPDPEHPGGWLVVAADLPEISLTPRPAEWR